MSKWLPSEDALLRSMYAAGLSGAEIAKRLGRSPGAIRNYAYKNEITQNLKWTDAEIAALKVAYKGVEFGEDIRLDELSKRLGRLKSNVSRKARELGLTDIGWKLKRKRTRPKVGPVGSPELHAHMSKGAKDRIAANGHPRGMLGKKHKAETLRVISEKSAAHWASMTDAERVAHTLKGLKTRLANGTLTPPQVGRGSWKAGWREIGGRRHYFRSRWEANYARWLQLLKDRGEIVDWEFEPHTFWFEKIMRGVRSYKPDFRVTGGLTPDEVTWHEVKGWMDARSRTTLKRMAKYHPDEIIILIRESAMKGLNRSVGLILEDWE